MLMRAFAFNESESIGTVMTGSGSPLGRRHFCSRAPRQTVFAANSWSLRVCGIVFQRSESHASDCRVCCLMNESMKLNRIEDFSTISVGGGCK